MRSTIFTFWLFFSLLVDAHAQSTLPKSTTDSLLAVWTDPDQHDTVRLNSMDDLVWDGYLFSQPDSANYYAQLQFHFAQSKGLKGQMAKALNAQGVSWATRAEYRQALDCYQRSLNLMEEIGDKNGVAKALNNIGMIYKAQGDYPEALDYFQRSYRIPEEMGDKEGSAAALNNIGMIYKIQGDYPEALSYFLRGLKLNEEVGNQSLYALNLNNVGVMYNAQGNDSLALDYFLRSLKIFEEIGDKNRTAGLHNSIGSIHENMGDLTRAIDYQKRSLIMRTEIDDKEGIAFSMNDIGTLYSRAGDYPQALDYLKQGLIIREEIGDKKGAASSLSSIGLLSLEQKRPDLAIEWCQKGQELADEIGAIEEQEVACECLFTAFKEMGVYDRALMYYEQMIIYRDSLYNEENTKKLARVEMQYEIDKKEAAMQAEQKLIEEKTTRRNNLQYSISFIIILLIFGLVLGLGYISVSHKLTEALILFSVLILFEFCLMFLDPFKSRLTGNQPAYTLMFNAVIALILLPVHIFFENRLKKKIIRK